MYQIVWLHELGTLQKQPTFAKFGHGHGDDFRHLHPAG